MSFGTNVSFKGYIKRVLIKAKEKNINILTLTIGILSTIGALISAISAVLNPELQADFVFLAAAFILGPYSFYEWRIMRDVDAMEEEFPNFMSDIAENRKAGLTIENSIKIAASGNYGKFTGEIKKIYSKLSWGIPLVKVLEDYVAQTKSTLIRRGLSLLMEAYRAGGGVYESLRNASDDARNMFWLKIEKKNEMVIYLMIVYIAFFVFLVIILLMAETFLPAMASMAPGGVNATSVPIQGLNVKPLDLDFYNNVFYWAVIIQAIGGGIIGGVMYDASMVSGMRHAFIMCLIAYLFFRGLVFGVTNLIPALPMMILLIFTFFIALLPSMTESKA